MPATAARWSAPGRDPPRLTARPSWPPPGTLRRGPCLFRSGGMEAFKARGKVHWQKGREQALAVYRSRRGRRIGLGLSIAVVVFGLLGFFAAPPLIRSQIESRASAALGRA